MQDTLGFHIANRFHITNSSSIDEKVNIWDMHLDVLTCSFQYSREVKVAKALFSNLNNLESLYLKKKAAKSIYLLK